MEKIPKNAWIQQISTTQSHCISACFFFLLSLVSLTINTFLVKSLSRPVRSWHVSLLPSFITKDITILLGEKNNYNTFDIYNN